MVALVLCALMLSIGFLLGPLGLPRPTFPDENQYSTMVDVLRGDASFEDVEAPFRARVLVPALASILPLDPTQRSSSGTPSSRSPPASRQCGISGPSGSTTSPPC